MSSGGTTLAGLASPLFDALGADLVFALAWLALAAAAALRRRALGAAGSLASWLPIVALLALAMLVAPAPFADTRVEHGPSIPPSNVALEPARWTPRSTGERGVLNAASWRELQALLLRGSGSQIAANFDGATNSMLLVPAHWRLPAGANIAAMNSPESTAETTATPAWVLEHPTVVPTRRSVSLSAWGSHTAEEAEDDLVLEARIAGSVGWVEWARARLDAGSGRIDFEWEAAAPGSYALRLRRSAVDVPLLQSALEIAPPPQVRALGAGLASLVAGLRAQGYEVVERGVPEPDDDLVLFGAGVRDFVATNSVLHYIEAGGGVFLAHPDAWEAVQTSAWGHTLPARVEPEAPSAKAPSPPTAEAREPSAKAPSETLPQKEQAPAGRFALFVILDLSGSFRTALPGAWAQLETALGASEGFELVGMAGFNREGHLLLSLGAYGDRLSDALARERQNILRYADLGGGGTLFMPALRIAAQELDREAPAASLIVVISDGIFDDRKSEWERFIEQELVLQRGYLLAAIRVVDEQLRRNYPPHALQSGQDNMDRIATIGLTKSTSRKSDLGSAIRFIPVVAREVQTASSWTPSGPGRKPPKAEAKPDSPTPEAPELAAQPLIPEARGTHPVEGLPGELDGEPWPALTALRRVRLGAGAALAWLVAPRREPMIVTGTIGGGRIALSASALDASGWPRADSDPRFPLFAARIADVLRRPEPPTGPWRARVRSAARAVEPSSEAPSAEHFLDLAGAGEQPGMLQGSARRDAAGRIQSTLRWGAPPSGLEGERPLFEMVREASAGEAGARPVTAPAVASSETGRWLAALGLWLGLALAMETAMGLWARARAGSR